jgi:hypothetical protein
MRPPVGLDAPPEQGYNGEDLIVTSGHRRRLNIPKKTLKKD